MFGQVARPLPRLMLIQIHFELSGGTETSKPLKVTQGCQVDEYFVFVISGFPVGRYRAVTHIDCAYSTLLATLPSSSVLSAFHMCSHSTLNSCKTFSLVVGHSYIFPVARSPPEPAARSSPTVSRRIALRAATPCSQQQQRRKPLERECVLNSCHLDLWQASKGSLRSLMNSIFQLLQGT